MLQRLVRVHQVLAQAVRRQRLPGAEAALPAGYHDPSQLARDMRALAGAPLRELLDTARADADGWPLATQRLMPGARCATTGNRAGRAPNPGRR